MADAEQSDGDFSDKYDETSSNAIEKSSPDKENSSSDEKESSPVEKVMSIEEKTSFSEDKITFTDDRMKSVDGFESPVDRNSSPENSTADILPSLSLEGSVVASPSIESFSTLAEGDQSLTLDERVDLVVRVDNPIKQADLLETYITFRVTTKTSREGYPAPSYQVRRRYNDFVWLRQHLVHNYPTYFVPALPVKHTIMGQFDRYGREFVTARMAALQVFLNRVVDHPILSFAPCFKCFLTANSEEFQDLRRLTANGLLSKVSESWKSLSTLHIETHRPPEMTKLHDYLGNLSEKLNNLCRIGQRIHRERSEQARELGELVPSLNSWAGSDAELTRDLVTIANATGACENAMHSILLENDNILVTQPLKEYILYVEAVKETLDRRDELEVELLYRRELLDKKKAELAAAEAEASAEAPGGLRAWVKPFETKEERIAKLRQGVQQSENLVEESRDKVECANGQVRSDTERWQKDKQTDLKNILLAFADQHINYYQQCGQSWNDVLKVSKSQQPSSSGSS